MEKYYLLGIAAAVIFISLIILLFGFNGSVQPLTAVQANANSSFTPVKAYIKNAIADDIIGLQTSQINMPSGKAVYYTANYSISTSTILSNGTYQNTSELYTGKISFYRSQNGNSESVENFTVRIPYSQGLVYDENFTSYLFSIGNRSYSCIASYLSNGKPECEALNYSLENISDTVLNSINVSDIKLIKEYNTTYKGYPCLFTASSFQIYVNSSNSLLNGISNESISGIFTECHSFEYNITVLSSLAADISTNVNNSDLRAISFINYNLSIAGMQSFNRQLTQANIPSNP